MSYVCCAQWTTHKAWGGLHTVTCLITHHHCGRGGHHNTLLSWGTFKCNRWWTTCVLNSWAWAVGTQIWHPICDLFPTFQWQKRTQPALVVPASCFSRSTPLGLTLPSMTSLYLSWMPLGRHALKQLCLHRKLLTFTLPVLLIIILAASTEASSSDFG